MEAYICTTCGVQYSPSSKPPAQCLVCEDERQYVNIKGQSWTTLDELQKIHTNVIKPLEPGLWEISTQPGFAIGQRAVLIQTSIGNLLWDCTCLVSKELVVKIKEMGGLFAIAISHPHFYSTMVEWSLAFGSIPIYLHGSDAGWVMNADPTIRYWSGPTLPLTDGLSLILVGGHFEGSAALHWQSGAYGQGVLFSGDMPQVVSDHHYVSFMRSYPNLIPVSAQAIRAILDNLRDFEFERIYGGWATIPNDGKTIVTRSAERYLKAIKC
jgi:glyoxylase-like metal-dependent hydrolase (beta-lactamase superfamily II)